jgi:S1-C subfamily serine protease
MITRVTIIVLLSVVAAWRAAPAAPAAPAGHELSGPAVAAAIEDAVVEAIARAEKSVVAIARVRRERPGELAPLEFRPDPFGRRFTPLHPPRPGDPDFIPNEYAAGVVVDARGLILTVYHLLAEDSDYWVTTSLRKTFRASIKAADPRSDLAVLAIDATDLVPIPLGNAAELKKGQFVIALGNPYAIAHDGSPSAAWGIVANIGRKLTPSAEDSESGSRRTLYQFGALIQTDAKLNIGNSGGALLNLRGEMVGLTIAAVSPAGFESAAGYAIPVDQTFRRVIETLKQGREVEYGFLGVQPVNLKPEESRGGLRGLRVDRVVPGTPAARAGLRTDDLITAVNGQPVHDADDLVLQVGRLPVEALVRLDIVRQGRPQRVEVTLAKFPVRGKKIFTVPAPDWRGMRVDYPTALAELDPRMRATLAFSDEGVIVSGVEENSPAWRAGIRRGMLVSEVAGKSVRTPREFHAAVAGHHGTVMLRTVSEEGRSVHQVPPS